MAGKKQLPPVRVVTDDDAVFPMSYAEAAARGSRLDELRAMLRVLAAHIDSENTLARDLAPLMRQAREISKEIEELEAVADGAGSGAVVDVEDARWKPEAI